VPYVLPPDEDALVATVAAGLPVLLLQKLGAGPVPGWHYAVLVGYDAPRDRFVLRSGTERRKEMSGPQFLATWDRAGRWALVALPPGVLRPRRISHATWKQLRASRRSAAARRRHQPMQPPRAAGRPSRCPAGAGQSRLRARRPRRGRAGFHAAAQLDPQDAAARNNRAEVLRQLGCMTAARREIEVARALAVGGPLAPAVESTARQIAEQAQGDAVGCPAD